MNEGSKQLTCDISHDL